LANISLSSILVVTLIFIISIFTLFFCLFILGKPNMEIQGVDITVNPTTINWGTLNAGSSNTEQIQIINTDNTPKTLYLSTSNLPSYLAQSWDKEGYVINGYSTVVATLTLVVNSNATPGAFHYTTTITGVIS
jgi:hypothetical protein